MDIRGRRSLEELCPGEGVDPTCSAPVLLVSPANLSRRVLLSSGESAADLLPLFYPDLLGDDFAWFLCGCRSSGPLDRCLE